MGHGPALGFGDIGDDGAVQATGLEGTATRTINRNFSRSFLRHFNSAELPQHVGSESGTRGDLTTARCNSAWVIGGNQLRFQRVAFTLTPPAMAVVEYCLGRPQ